MTAKRFEVYKVIGSFREWCIEDNVDGKFVTGSIMSKYGADRLCKKLNALHEENQTLLHIIDWCLTHHREVGHIVFDSRDEFFIWLKEKGVLE